MRILLSSALLCCLIQAASGQSITTPNLMYPRATIDHLQMFVSEDEIDSIWAYLKAKPRTATAWATIQNQVNALEKEVDSLIKALRDRDKIPPHIEFLNGDFKIMPMSDLEIIHTIYDPYMITATVDTTKWMRRPYTIHPANAFLGYTVGDTVCQDIKSALDAASRQFYRTNIADPASAKVVHFNNGCDLGTVKHGKGWARKHKVKEK